MSELRTFVAARIREDYQRERGDAAEYTVREFGARLRANALLSAMNGSTVTARGLIPTDLALARRYTDHPDFDPSWLDTKGSP